MGAGGFIGSHLVTRLKKEDFFVRGVDLKYPEFSETKADQFVIGDLREFGLCQEVMLEDYDEIYQLAADMGGAGYIFTGENDADVMYNSAQINLHIAQLASGRSRVKVFYASSACIYPEYNQLDPANPKCSENSAYPAMPDSEYGWEKLFSERLFLAFRKNHQLDVRIARFHNIFGEESSWKGGREKAPTALCRKIAMADDGSEIEIWGDGFQTRSFLYIQDCLDAVRLLMDSDFYGPVNIGSEEMVSINDFADMIIGISGKNLALRHIKGPVGVRGRRSDNALIERKLAWKPRYSLDQGIEKVFYWVHEQVVSEKIKS